MLLANASTAQSAEKEVTPIVRDLSGKDYFIISGVNIRNGNYTSSFNVIEDPEKYAGYDFNFTYNSLSSGFQGSYGMGWSTPFDSRLYFDGDSGLFIKENGIGGHSSYQQIKPGYEYAQGDRPIVKFKNGGDMPEGLTLYVQDHFTSDICRSDSAVEKEPNASRIKRTFSRDCPFEYEAYDLQGHYLHRAPKRFVRGASPVQTTDPKTGKVSKVAIGNQSTLFFHDDKGMLIRAVWNDWLTRVFSYDKNNNLIEVKLTNDGTTTKIAYNPNGLVASVIDRSDVKTTFDYFDDPYDPKIQATRVTRQAPGKDKEVLIFRMPKD
jgi:hypothetical protein